MQRAQTQRKKKINAINRKKMSRSLRASAPNFDDMDGPDRFLRVSGHAIIMPLGCCVSSSAVYFMLIGSRIVRHYYSP